MKYSFLKGEVGWIECGNMEGLLGSSEISLRFMIINIKGDST